MYVECLRHGMIGVIEGGTIRWLPEISPKPHGHWNHDPGDMWYIDSINPLSASIRRIVPKWEIALLLLGT